MSNDYKDIEYESRCTINRVWNGWIVTWDISKDSIEPEAIDRGTKVFKSYDEMREWLEDDLFSEAIWCENDEKKELLAEKRKKDKKCPSCVHWENNYECYEHPLDCVPPTYEHYEKKEEKE